MNFKYSLAKKTRWIYNRSISLPQSKQKQSPTFSSTRKELAITDGCNFNIRIIATGRRSVWILRWERYQFNLLHSMLTFISAKLARYRNDSVIFYRAPFTAATCSYWNYVIWNYIRFYAVLSFELLQLKRKFSPRRCLSVWRSRSAALITLYGIALRSKAMSIILSSNNYII